MRGGKKTNRTKEKYYLSGYVQAGTYKKLDELAIFANVECNPMLQATSEETEKCHHKECDTHKKRLLKERLCLHCSSPFSILCSIKTLSQNERNKDLFHYCSTCRSPDEKYMQHEMLMYRLMLTKLRKKDPTYGHAPEMWNPSLDEKPFHFLAAAIPVLRRADFCVLFGNPTGASNPDEVYLQWAKVTESIRRSDPCACKDFELKIEPRVEYAAPSARFPLHDALGLFSTKKIDEGEVIGAYNGFVHIFAAFPFSRTQRYNTNNQANTINLRYTWNMNIDDLFKLLGMDPLGAAGSRTFSKKKGASQEIWRDDLPYITLDGDGNTGTMSLINTNINIEDYPNCEVHYASTQDKLHLLVIASSLIEKNSELFIDYGESYYLPSL